MRPVVCKQPPGLLHLLNRGPWPEVKGGAEGGRSPPARKVTGGGVCVEGEYHRILAHPRPYGIGRGWLEAAVQQRRAAGGGGNRRGSGRD
jgi:hypothetical protein